MLDDIICINTSKGDCPVLELQDYEVKELHAASDRELAPALGPYTLDRVRERVSIEMVRRRLG